MTWLRLRHLPNVITIGRILLVGPTVWAILRQRFDLALVLFFIAGVSDGIDGFLAKHFGWTSRLGSLLDPLADKLLMVSSYAACAWTGLLPLWLAALVVGRDLLILTGATAYYLLLHPFEGQPSWVSKLNTLLQIVLLLAVLGQHGLVSLPVVLIQTLIYSVAATTIVSGLHYVIVWGGHLVRQLRGM